MKALSIDSIINTLIDYQNEARALGCRQADLGFLATTNSDQPNIRIITIYEMNKTGFLFLANKTSGKIQQLIKNPKAGLCFYWDEIHLQVTVEGSVKALDESTSNELWNRRDHQANIAAWAIDNAENKQQENDLTAHKQYAREQFVASRIPMAESWGGYVLQPERIEWWQAKWRKGKKHQCYTLINSSWKESQYYY